MRTVSLTRTAVLAQRRVSLRLGRVVPSTAKFKVDAGYTVEHNLAKVTNSTRVKQFLLYN